MSCCKIDTGICATAVDCDQVIIGGADDLRIAVLCAVLSTTETACSDANSKEITAITMDNDPMATTTGDTDHQFYQYSTSSDTLSFAFDWQYDVDNKSTVFNETVTGRLAVRNSAALCALESLFRKEIVILIKENGDDGKWIISGLGGDLYLTQVTGGTGTAKTDTTEATITITGALDKRFMYVNWGAADDQTSTNTEIDNITVTC